MGLDPAAMRLRACDVTGCSLACGLIRSAADEIDELRRKVARLEDNAELDQVGLRNEERAHAETKRHVEKLAELLDDANACDDDCDLAGILAWVDPRDRQRVAEIRRREEADLAETKRELEDIQKGAAVSNRRGPLKTCCNGCDAPPHPPSWVLCKACLERLAAKMRKLGEALGVASQAKPGGGNG